MYKARSDGGGASVGGVRGMGQPVYEELDEDEEVEDDDLSLGEAIR